ncbi:MAG: DEAD/DEAH box helicase family protein [Spirochaetes bacterium]|nr:DEAD/DEAH box helicase family protein [Spirochaetota bacterium]
MEALEYLSPTVAARLAREIAGYRGQEIFFGGNLGDSGLVEEVELLARGNPRMVPVLFERATSFDVVLHNHPSSILEPSDADLEIAASLGNHGTGFYIVDNAAAEINVVVPHREAEAVEPLDEEALVHLFGPEGEVAAKLPGYESRPSQLSMLRGVIRAFNRGEIYLCEAPTGTGKSLGYLVPAALWAHRNREKVIVSTHTIALQEQLITRDLPRLRELLGVDFSFALVKGRNNYLCRRKFGEFEHDGGFFAEEDAGGEDQLATLLEWGKATDSGDRAELPFVPSPFLWDRLASESDTCQQSRCAHADRCHVQKARRKNFAADLLVVNHHILCADMALKAKAGRFNAQALLPAWKRLVVDEAHNLEDTATDHFAIGYSSLAIARTLNLLSRPARGKQAGSGLLRLIAGRLGQGHTRLSADDQQTALSLIDMLEKDRLQHMDRASDFHLTLFQFLSGKEGGDFGEKKWRVKTGVHREAGFHEGFREPVEGLSASLEGIRRRLEKLVKIIEDERDDPEWDRLITDAQAYGNRLAEPAGVLESLLDDAPAADEGRVRWVSAQKLSRGALLVQASVSPLEIGTQLREALFEPAATVVLTSATLTDHRGFQFLRQRLGLTAEGAESLFRPVLEESLPAVFDYRVQCAAFLPEDLPLPQDPAFNERSCGIILEAATFFHGRTMVLFTSYGQLAAMRRILSPQLEALGIRLLAQGDAPRNRLLDEFRGAAPTVLLGVNSFWEGVDVPGEALSCLVIVKLPFAVPSEPLAAARTEALERAGRNAFSEYSLPVAILRFRQGFGRLIRTRSDRGLFVMLDRRLLDKNYGKDFLKALPALRIFKGNSLQEAAETVM